MSKTIADIKTYTGAEFVFLIPEGAISAVLAEVNEAEKIFKSIKNTRQSGRVKNTTRNFILSFQMPTGDFLQANYQLWHPDFGQFELFLVPEQRGDEKFLLHAVINRL